MISVRILRKLLLCNKIELLVHVEAESSTQLCPQMWLFGSVYEKKVVEVACIKFLCFIECPLQVALAIYLARLFCQGGRSNTVGMFLFCILWLAELVGAFVSKCVGQLHLKA